MQSQSRQELTLRQAQRFRSNCVFTLGLRSPIKCAFLQTWIHVAVLVLSGAFYFGFVLLFSMVCVTCSPPTNPVGVETLQMSQPLFYIICALTTVMALLPRYTHSPSYTILWMNTQHKTLCIHTSWVPLQCILLRSLHFNTKYVTSHRSGLKDE